MLYALADPLSFVLLVVAFVVSTVVAGWLSSLACARVGLREPGRGRPDPRRQLDPFGAVGAAVSGMGWARPVEVPSNRRGPGVALAVLTGPVVVLVVGLAVLAAFGAAHGPVPGSAAPLRDGAGGLPAAQEAWFLGGLVATYVGVLSLVPLPPLPGGQALFAVAPQTTGWQKARYQLVDRNIGTGIVLGLLLLQVLPEILSRIVDPLVRAVTGG